MKLTLILSLFAVFALTFAQDGAEENPAPADENPAPADETADETAAEPAADDSEPAEETDDDASTDGAVSHTVGLMVALPFIARLF